VNETSLIIVLHQLVFQACFVFKNLTLSRKLSAPVRGQNPEAQRAIRFFALFILVSLLLAASELQFGRLRLVPDDIAVVACLVLLAMSMVFGLTSLRDLGESWRVGVLEDQTTELVEDGIYRFSRNPYFVAYLLMFAAYSLLLQSLVLLALGCVGFGLIHAMILKEERYLDARHGQAYRDYQRRVPRYLLR
jgi:protein-S-isoprenylcysteine O-methyltransferase Ste14